MYFEWNTGVNQWRIQSLGLTYSPKGFIYFLRVLLTLGESAGGLSTSKNRRRTKYTTLRKLRCFLNEIPVRTSGKFRAQV